MHAAYFRPGGVYRICRYDAPVQSQQDQNAKALEAMNQNRQGSLLDFIDDFTRASPVAWMSTKLSLTDNRIWKQRTVGIGVVKPERALNLGMTGPMLRGSGIAGICARRSPTMLTIGSILIFRLARRAIATTDIWFVCRKCASPIASSSNAWIGCVPTLGRSSLTTTKLPPLRANP